MSCDDTIFDTFISKVDALIIVEDKVGATFSGVAFPNTLLAGCKNKRVDVLLPDGNGITVSVPQMACVRDGKKQAVAFLDFSTKEIGSLGQSSVESIVRRLDPSSVIYIKQNKEKDDIVIDLVNAKGFTVSDIEKESVVSSHSPLASFPEESNVLSQACWIMKMLLQNKNPAANALAEERKRNAPDWTQAFGLVRSSGWMNVDQYGPNVTDFGERLFTSFFAEKDDALAANVISVKTQEVEQLENIENPVIQAIIQQAIGKKLPIGLFRVGKNLDKNTERLFVCRVLHGISDFVSKDSSKLENKSGKLYSYERNDNKVENKVENKRNEPHDYEYYYNKIGRNVIRYNDLSILNNMIVFMETKIPRETWTMNVFGGVPEIGRTFDLALFIFTSENEKRVDFYKKLKKELESMKEGYERYMYLQTIGCFIKNNNN